VLGRRRWRTLGALALLVGVVVALAPPALARPPGNNGTVKIDEFTMDPGQDNDPHVACDFSISFFGYDAGQQSATMTIEAWAPTAGGSVTLPTLTFTVPSRTGGDQLDANRPVRFSEVAPAFAGVSPQPQQGFHAKLTVHVTGSQGADVKHKVFWIEPCAGAQPTVTPTQAPTVAGRTTTAGPIVAPETAKVVVAATTAAAPPVPTQVLGETFTKPPPAAPATAVKAVSLARTGLRVGLLLALAALLLLAGTGLLRSTSTD
jgi:hypothetical protein